MKGLAGSFAAIMRTKLAEQLAYRSHFFLSLFLLIAGDLVIPLITLLVYRSGAAYPGWTLHEVLLIQAIFALAKGIAFPFFFGMISSTLNLVREGTFDLLLLKPKPVLFMSMMSGFEPDDFGRVVSGCALFLYAFNGLPVPSAADWLRFAVLFIVSLAVLASFSLVMAALLFKWVGSSRVFDIFDAVTSFGMYPGTIFSKAFRNFLTYVLPIGLIAFVPSEALLHRTGWGALWSTAAAAAFLAAAGAFWHAMLKRYTSAGG